MRTAFSSVRVGTLREVSWPPARRASQWMSQCPAMQQLTGGRCIGMTHPTVTPCLIELQLYTAGRMCSCIIFINMHTQFQGLCQFLPARARLTDPWVLHVTHVLRQQFLRCCFCCQGCNFSWLTSSPDAVCSNKLLTCHHARRDPRQTRPAFLNPPWQQSAFHKAAPLVWHAHPSQGPLGS